EHCPGECLLQRRVGPREVEHGGQLDPRHTPLALCGKRIRAHESFQPIVGDPPHDPRHADGQAVLVGRSGGKAVDGERFRHPTRTAPAMPAPSRDPTDGVPMKPSSPMLVWPTTAGANHDGGPMSVVSASRTWVPTRIPAPSSQTLPIVWAGRWVLRMSATTVRCSVLSV